MNSSEMKPLFEKFEMFPMCRLDKLDNINNENITIKIGETFKGPCVIIGNDKVFSINIGNILTSAVKSIDVLTETSCIFHTRNSVYRLSKETLTNK